MISHFLNLEWKQYFRSAHWQKGIAIKIIMVFLALYFVATFLAIGVGGYYILKKGSSTQHRIADESRRSTWTAWGSAATASSAAPPRPTAAAGPQTERLQSSSSRTSSGRRRSIWGNTTRTPSPTIPCSPIYGLPRRAKARRWRQLADATKPKGRNYRKELMDYHAKEYGKAPSGIPIIRFRS